MNVDHFFWIDTADVLPKPASSPNSPSPLFRPIFSIWNTLFPSFSFSHSTSSPPLLKTTKKESLPKDLAEDYLALPKLSKLDLGAFAPIVNVGPSVVTTYYPAIRVFTYNVTGVADDGESVDWESRRANLDEAKDIEKSDDEDELASDDIESTTNVGIEYVFQLVFVEIDVCNAKLTRLNFHQTPF